MNTAKNASISGATGRVKEFVRSERGSSKPESKGTHKGAVSTAAAKGSQSGSNVSSSSAQAKVKQGSSKSSTSSKASATAVASAAGNKVGGSSKGSANGALAQGAAVGTATLIESVKLHRPYKRKNFKEQVNSNYDLNEDGIYVHKKTGVEIYPPIHFGHRYAYEHRRLEKAAREVGMNQKEFNDYVNARPNYFQIENAKDNMSHKNEKPGKDDLDIIKKDMINFLKKRRLK